MKNSGFRLIISLFIGALFLASLYKIYMILNSLVLFQELKVFFLFPFYHISLLFSSFLRLSISLSNILERVVHIH